MLYLLFPFIPLGKNQLNSVKMAFDKMTELSEEAMTFMAMVDAVDQGSDADIAVLMGKIGTMKTAFENHLDAVKLLISKVKSYVNSL